MSSAGSGTDRDIEEHNKVENGIGHSISSVSILFDSTSIVTLSIQSNCHERRISFQSFHDSVSTNPTQYSFFSLTIRRKSQDGEPSLHSQAHL